MRELPNMSIPRYHHGFIKYKGDLWAIGGSDGEITIKAVESFDPVNCIWTSRPYLNISRFAPAVVVHHN